MGNCISDIRIECIAEAFSKTLEFSDEERTFDPDKVYGKK